MSEKANRFTMANGLVARQVVPMDEKEEPSMPRLVNEKCLLMRINWITEEVDGW